MKELSHEDRTNRSDFVDIGYSNTDVARTENSGTTEDATEQSLKEEREEEEDGESDTSHMNPRGRYHDGSPSPHYQERSPTHCHSASPKDEEVGSQGDEDERMSAGYGGEDIHRGSSPSTSVKMKADPSRRTESPGKYRLNF